MRHKREGLLIGIVYLMVVLFSCFVIGCSQEKSDNVAPKPKDIILSIGTGSSGGDFNIVGTGIADAITNGVEGVVCVAEETGGGKDNVALITKNDINMAIVGMATAVPNIQNNDINMFLHIYSPAAHIIAQSKYGIKDLRDIGGLKVCIGPMGSGGTIFGTLLLEAHGITPDNCNFVYMGYGEILDSLADGTLDVGLYWFSLPSTTLNTLMGQRDLTLLNIDMEAVLASKMPTIVGNIPAGTYVTQDEQVDCVFDPVPIFIRGEVDEGLVYDCTKAVFEALPRLTKGVKFFEEVRFPSEEELEIYGVGLHPGVARYKDETK